MPEAWSLPSRSSSRSRIHAGIGLHHRCFPATNFAFEAEASRLHLFCGGAADRVESTQLPLQFEVLGACFVRHTGIARATFFLCTSLTPVTRGQHSPNDANGSCLWRKGTCKAAVVHRVPKIEQYRKWSPPNRAGDLEHRRLRSDPCPKFLFYAASRPPKGI